MIDTFLEGEKVVSATKMRFVEEKACAKGASSLRFMQTAAKEIAQHTAAFIEQRGLEKQVTLVLGKGNNAGDAYAAGEILLKQNFRVKAHPVYSASKLSELCSQMREAFLAAGGQIEEPIEEKGICCEFQGVVLDGLLGTGFQGVVDGVLRSVIEHLNSSCCPILSIDIPSGVNGDTGSVQTVAVRATQTLSLGFVKSGLILDQGLNHTGDVSVLSFGLAKEDTESADPIAYLLNENNMSYCLPPIERARHKYQAGFVLAFAGSSGMSGAAALATHAALRTGSGMVRLYHPQGLERELFSLAREVMRKPWDGKKLKNVLEDAKRAKAFLIGPGMGRIPAVGRAIKKVLKELKLPCVIDADALYFLAQNPQIDPPRGAVLTPHHGEMQGLISHRKKHFSFEQMCQDYAEEKRVTLVLKGAATWIFHPGEEPLVNLCADPGMATAGSGDVLSGMIAALLAQGLPPQRAAALGVYLHGLSGKIAAKKLTSYCLMASDLISHLPDAFSQLMR